MLKLDDVSKVVLCGRHNILGRFSEDALHFSWQAQHFRRGVLGVFCESQCQPARSGDKVQIAWQGWHFVTGDEK